MRRGNAGEGDRRPEAERPTPEMAAKLLKALMGIQRLLPVAPLLVKSMQKTREIDVHASRALVHGQLLHSTLSDLRTDWGSLLPHWVVVTIFYHLAATMMMLEAHQEASPRQRAAGSQGPPATLAYKDVARYFGFEDDPAKSSMRERAAWQWFCNKYGVATDPVLSDDSKETLDTLRDCTGSTLATALAVWAPTAAAIEPYLLHLDTPPIWIWCLARAAFPEGVDREWTADCKTIASRTAQATTAASGGDPMSNLSPAWWTIRRLAGPALIALGLGHELEGWRRPRLALGLALCATAMAESDAEWARDAVVRVEKAGSVASRNRTFANPASGILKQEYPVGSAFEVPDLACILFDAVKLDWVDELLSLCELSIENTMRSGLSAAARHFVVQSVKPDTTVAMSHWFHARLLGDFACGGIPTRQLGLEEVAFLLRRVVRKPKSDVERNRAVLGLCALHVLGDVSAPEASSFPGWGNWGGHSDEAHRILAEVLDDKTVNGALRPSVRDLAVDVCRGQFGRTETPSFLSRLWQADAVPPDEEGAVELPVLGLASDGRTMTIRLPGEKSDMPLRIGGRGTTARSKAVTVQNRLGVVLRKLVRLEPPPTSARSALSVLRRVLESVTGQKVEIVGRGGKAVLRPECLVTLALQKKVDDADGQEPCQPDERR